MHQLPPGPRLPAPAGGPPLMPATVRAWLVFLRALDDLADREARACGAVYQRSATADLLTTALLGAARGLPPQPRPAAPTPAG